MIIGAGIRIYPDPYFACTKTGKVTKRYPGVVDEELYESTIGSYLQGIPVGGDRRAGSPINQRGETTTCEFPN